MLRAATSGDLLALRPLLTSSGLPLDGLAQTHLFVAEEGGAVVGAIGFEAYGRSGLLRSLVVHPGHRGAGLGSFLLEAGLVEMRRAGLQEAYGLTTTIAPWLKSLGWEEVPRSSLPKELLASRELQGACPDSAVAFRLDLTQA